jgi:peptidoglycan/xylan/chitin deacetylase (PgdA/CDA1 family)
VTKLASISIDLDDVCRYTGIHGVGEPPPRAAHAVYDHCVRRLTAWLDDESIRATFFVIGEDLERDENRAVVASLHAAGHEIGNHSHHHHYDLASREPDEIQREIELGATAIAEVCGTRPTGFRAPGYTMTDVMFDALEAARIEYDSSVFPCPSYYALKAAALAGIRLRRRQSESRLDTPAVLRAPRDPYRVGRPYWTRGKGMVELPIGVTRFQLPYIGTSLVLGGARVAAQLTKQMLGRTLINLELHGFDVADATEDGLEALVPHRPDLRRPAFEKLDSLRAAVRLIRNAGYELVTLDEAAKRFSSGPNR